MEPNLDLIDKINNIKLGNKVTLFRNFRAYRKLDGTLTYMVRDNNRSISSIDKLHTALIMHRLLHQHPNDSRQQLWQRYQQEKQQQHEAPVSTN